VTSVVENRESPAKVGSQRRVVYKDGTVQLLRLLELNDATRSLTYEIVMSEPPVTYTSAIHTIRLRNVTWDKQTVIECVSDYSNDADAAVIADSKYKKLEFIKAVRDNVLGKSNAPNFDDFVRRAGEAERIIRLLSQRLERLEQSRRGDKKEFKGGEELYTVTRGFIKPGVGKEASQKFKEFIRVAAKKVPGLLYHSGFVLLSDTEFLLNTTCRDSATLQNLMQNELKDSSQYLGSILAGMPTVKVYGKPSDELRKFLSSCGAEIIPEFPGIFRP